MKKMMEEMRADKKPKAKKKSSKKKTKAEEPKDEKPEEKKPESLMSKMKKVVKKDD